MLIGNHYLGEGQIQALRPRVTFTVCSLWKVERTDGVVQRFASHDKWMVHRQERYEPAGPLASDMEQTEAGVETDFQIVGFLSADSIRASDIHAHRYDGAKITHTIVDWMRPWVWFRKHVWWVRELTEDGGLFEAKVAGVERFLQIPVGRFYERECDKVLGSAECGALPKTLFGAVVEAVGAPGATILGVPHSTSAVRFSAASWLWSPAIRDGLLTQGKLVWTSGPNKGVEQLIGEHIGRELSLELPAPFRIKAGDVATLLSGCNGSRSACDGDYDNGINYGGQFLMPSTEDTYRKPVVN